MRGVWKGAAAAAAAKGSGDSRGQQGTAGGSRRHGLKATPPRNVATCPPLL